MTHDEMTRLCDTLRAFETPAVANAVETFGVRDLTDGYASSDIRALIPGRGPMVGYAVTVTFDSTTGGSARRSRWFDLMDLLKATPYPTVVVSQYIGSDRRRGCWLGDIVATLLVRLGSVGTVTDAAVRDLHEMEGRLPDFSVFGLGSVASHGNGAVIDLDIPVSIGGLLIRPGDLVHGDRNGLITSPGSIADQVAEATATVARDEADLVELLMREPLPFEEIRGRFSH
jgi:regulator of RNase E activity RraA